MRYLSTFIACTLLIMTIPGFADVKPASLFSDGMVLQRDVPVPVWGWADPGEKVTVFFAGTQAEGTADNDGKWLVDLPPAKVNAVGSDLTISGKNTITVKDVLVGDVWLGSGQSNMEWAVKDSANSQAEIVGATCPKIRLFTVPKLMKGQKVERISAKWVVCSPETVRDFSAALYFFGRELTERTGIPIGLIHSSLGGTRIELWTAPEGFAAVPEFAETFKAINTIAEQYRAGLPAKLSAVEEWLNQTKAALADGKQLPVTPEWPEPPQGPGGAAVLYNAMIHPLIPYGIRGVVWYQGEWNGGEGDLYYKRMQALIAGWRELWDNKNLPFYYVQLARMPQKEQDPWLGDGWAPTREAQLKSLAIPNTGMAVIIDLDASSDYHPRNKQDVGKRLALWALKNEYGCRDIVASGPLYRGMTVEGGSIRISFDSIGTGLMVGAKEGLEPVKPAPDAALKGFAIAGENKQWFHAAAKIDGSTVVVSSPDVPSPVAVRYAYCQDPEGCNLYNKEGLPASPFRTDNR